MTTVAANPGFFVLYAMDEAPTFRRFPIIAWFHPGGSSKPIPICVVYGMVENFHAIMFPDGRIIDREENHYESFMEWMIRPREAEHA